MSTFSGKLEFPGIRIDRFTRGDEDDTIANIYFLSHFHSDHTIGITDLRRVENHVLYTSKITKIFVESKFPGINVEFLEIGYPKQMTTSEGLEFTVLTIPSGHCPGSVMFLFQTAKDSKRILYTGDFRISKKDLKQLTALKESLDSIYLDSTFFSEQYSHFPTQSQSIKLMIKRFEDHLRKEGPNFKILLKFSARIGYEYLIMQLHKHFKTKIYVSKDIYENYKFISNLGKITSTSNFHSSQFHVVPGVGFSIPPGYEKYNVLMFKLCALSWSNWTPSQSIFRQASNQLFRVCYSNHSSYEEIKEFLLLTKPKKVVLNVLPENETERARFLNNVKEIQKMYAEKGPEDCKKEVESIPVSNFKRLRSIEESENNTSEAMMQENNKVFSLETLDSSVLSTKKFKSVI